MGMSRHWFTFKYDYPRTTTRKEYKTISQWLRVCRNEVQDSIDQTDITKYLNDCAVCGTGTYFVPVIEAFNRLDETL